MFTYHPHFGTQTELMSDYCVTSSEQFFSHIMGRTSHISIWW